MNVDEFGELREDEIIGALNANDVEYVLVGGAAAILWGAQRPTRDIDCVARWTTANHRRICSALAASDLGPITLAALEDIIDSKQHADREKDRAALPELIAIRDRMKE